MILVVTSKRITGLNYHRQVVPFETLGLDYELCDHFDTLTDEDLKKYKCVSFLRTINLNGETEKVAERLHKLGIKIHFDIDDYWVLPTSHPMYHEYNQQRIPSQTVAAMGVADFITTTNAYLAGKIKELGYECYILPNAINPDHEQWKEVNVSSERMRFGYIAGVHHVRDVEALFEPIGKLWNDRTIYNKWQLLAAGFNLTKQNERVFMNAYYHYVEQIFTHNYKFTKGEYKKYLKLNVPTDNSKWDEPYKRLWGMDTFNYGKLYNYIDVSLVPLVDTEFNRCKSNLKLIEAGFMKKAVIVSDVHTYNEASTSNSIIIKQSRNHIDWFTAMRKLVLNPEMASDLGEAMYEAVKDKYHINTVNKERLQIFNHELK